MWETALCKRLLQLQKFPFLKKSSRCEVVIWRFFNDLSLKSLKRNFQGKTLNAGGSYHHRIHRYVEKHTKKSLPASWSFPNCEPIYTPLTFQLAICALLSFQARRLWSWNIMESDWTWGTNRKGFVDNVNVVVWVWTRKRPRRVVSDGSGEPNSSKFQNYT